MSDIYVDAINNRDRGHLDTDAIERATARERPTLGAGAGLDPNGMPYDPDHTVVNIDISQYLRPDGTYDIEGYLSNVWEQDILENGNVYDPGNPNTLVALAGALTNIFNPAVWNALSSSQKTYVENFLGPMMTNPNDPDTTLVDMAVTDMVGQFWNHNTNPTDPTSTREAATKAFLQNLLTGLGDTQSNSPWLGNLKSDLSDYINNFESEFYDNYGSMSSDDFNFAMMIDGEQIITNNQIMGQQYNMMNGMETYEAALKSHNPWELLIALMAMLTDQSNFYQMQMGGFGKTLQDVIPGLKAKADDLLNTWQGQCGQLTGDNLKGLLSELKELHLEGTADTRVSANASGFDAAYDAFFTVGSDNNMKFNANCTIGGVQYYSGESITDAIQWAFNSHAPATTFTDLATAINTQFGPQPTAATPVVPPEYTQGISLFEGCQSAVQSVSSTTTQEMQTVQGTSDKFLQMLGSLIGSYWDPVKTMETNSQQVSV